MEPVSAVSNMRGRAALFRGKVREPVSLTLTPTHHVKVQNAMQRLALTRADLIGLLIENYADTVTHEKGSMMKEPKTMTIPSAAEYEAVIPGHLSEQDLRMFEVHFRALNRSIAYHDIDVEFGWKPGVANLQYGLAAAKLSKALNFGPDTLGEKSKVNWYSSVIGMRDTTPRPKGSRFHFVMHHELATALTNLFPEWLKPKKGAA